MSWIIGDEDVNAARSEAERVARTHQPFAPRASQLS